MRNTSMSTNMMLVTLILVALFAISVLRPQQRWLYPLVRMAAYTKMDMQTNTMLSKETEHFIIRYTPDDEQSVAIVSTAAEEAYSHVVKSFQYSLKRKPLIIIYPTKQDMTKLMGQLGSEGAMGVYWGGVIQVLSPKAWLKSDKLDQDYITNGPMVHELTHLVFDYMTNGNYPRWFTEGLAQYQEYKAYNFEWITANNDLTRKIYSMEELDKSFDDLPNQSLAYRESLAAVRFIAEVYGEESLRLIIKSLQAGNSLPKSINTILGISYGEYAQSWPEWAKINMKKFAK